MACSISAALVLVRLRALTSFWKSSSRMEIGATFTEMPRDSRNTSVIFRSLGGISSNADTLVSIGGVQSNHTRMVAAVAAKIGMKCRLVQESWVPHEDAVYDRVGNILLSRVMGADVRLVDEGFDIGIRQSWEQAIAEVKAAGGKPYAIPAGASVHKYGGLGYVGFAEEVRRQEKELGFAFHHILLCTRTR